MPALQSARHLFPIGSISKTFTAVALLQLLDGGRIRLDTTIADLLDWLPEPLRSNEITLQRLLNHTAGVIGSVDALPDEIGQATLYTGRCRPPPRQLLPLFERRLHPAGFGRGNGVGPIARQPRRGTHPGPAAYARHRGPGHV